MSTFGFFVAENQGRKEKLQYFVGNGNNRNLIRSVMKKRWWWQETKEIAVANLIWTQLKHVETIDRQK